MTHCDDACNVEQSKGNNSAWSCYSLHNIKLESTICHICLKWFWEPDTDETDSETDTASEGKVWIHVKLFAFIG